MEHRIRAPFVQEEIARLEAGDAVRITGTVYTARDAAHKRMQEALLAGRPLPFDLRGAVIYYMGPSPARDGCPIGSAGPTTAGRMDRYTPALLDLGLRGMIAKGRRSAEVKEAIVRNKAVYLAAIGGAGALLSHHIRSAQIVAYEDLGTEAIRRLEVEEFPAVVVIDSSGRDLYAEVTAGILGEFGHVKGML